MAICSRLRCWAGWNANEGTLFFTGSPTTLQWTFPEGYDTRITKIKELFGQARGNKLIDLYQMNTEETYDKRRDRYAWR